MLENDYQLLVRLKNDDITAFDCIYRNYVNAVYANILKLIRDEASAEDLLQEVFIALWEKRRTLKEEGSLGGWLFVSSYNMSVNLLKKNLRQSLVQKHWQEQEAANASIDELQYELLEKAIGQLSPQKRRVFELCKLQGKTYEEAACQLQISKYTVKEYLSHAISLIREFIRNHPEASTTACGGIYLLIS